MNACLLRLIASLKTLFAGQTSFHKTSISTLMGRACPIPILRTLIQLPYKPQMHQPLGVEHWGGGDRYLKCGGRNGYLLAQTKTSRTCGSSPDAVICNLSSQGTQAQTSFLSGDLWVAGVLCKKQRQQRAQGLPTGSLGTLLDSVTWSGGHGFI